MKKLLLILLFASPAWATTYYVDNTNGSASDANAGTSPSLPWLTIGKCASTIVAGDICQVQTGGTYDARITETTDGLVASRITYQAQTGAPRPKVRGFSLVGADYVTVTGFEITSAGMSADSTASLAAYNAHAGDWFISNYIHDTTSACVAIGDSTGGEIIRSNTITLCGSGPYMGNVTALLGYFARPSTGVLYELNTVSYVSDYSNPLGTQWVIRNNTFGPADPSSPVHIDGMQNNGVATSSLFEGNLSTGNNNSDNHLFLNQIATSTGWIIRYNSLTDTTKGGLDWRVNSHSFYNNTFYDSIAGGNTNNFQILTTTSTGNISRNNIWYHASSATPYSGVGYDKDYDLWYLNGDPVETNDVNADPLFTNAPGGDFTLSAGSPAINAGGPLTTVAAADTGAGTSLVLTSAYPFQPGWAGTTADVIAVGTVGNTATISSIDYATGTVTLASGISRSDGDSVWLKSKSDGVVILNGTAPDIGSNESGGPTLTTVSPSSGAEGATVSVTLTGTDLDGGNAVVAVSGTGVTVSSVVVVNATTITADFAIAASAIIGARNVTVTTDDGVSNASTFTVTCVAAGVGFSTQPVSTALNSSLGSVQVQVQCGDSSVDTTSSASIVIAKAGSATWNDLTSASNPTLTKSATAGLATWTDLKVTPTPGSGSITAASSGLTGATSNSITITSTALTPTKGVRARVRAH